MSTVESAPSASRLVSQTHGRRPAAHNTKTSRRHLIVLAICLGALRTANRGWGDHPIELQPQKKTPPVLGLAAPARRRTLQHYMLTPTHQLRLSTLPRAAASSAGPGQSGPATLRGGGGAGQAAPASSSTQQQHCSSKQGASPSSSSSSPGDTQRALLLAGGPPGAVYGTAWQLAAKPG